ncbi:class A beta-lactamase-related serine hydrolase [Flavobacteriaceae bacterium]|nr:class A beta-lactamase-related serine hydrolase [Flavobacteriaceae bacterium]
MNKKLNGLISNFDGDVSIYVEHLETGFVYEFRSGELFPTASMIKVPIMIGIYQELEKNKLEYHELLTYSESMAYPGVDLLASFKDGSNIPLSEIIFLMIATSDNTASIWAQELAGGGYNINNIMAEFGFEHTRVNSRTPGRDSAFDNYGWGQTTSKEMTQIFKEIYENKIISPSASEDMYRFLCNQYWNGEALSQIPPFVQAAAKSGAVSHSRSETVLVNAPSGDYVFSIITKNQKDQSWESDNEGFVLIREVSKCLWNFFEPNHYWQPTKNAEEFYK